MIRLNVNKGKIDKRPPGIMIYLSEYLSFRPVLSLEQKGILLDALIDYLFEDQPDMHGDPLVKAAFSILSEKVERDTEKYLRKCETNKRIAQNRFPKKQAEEPNVTSRNQTLPVVTNSNCNCNSNCNSNNIDASAGGNPQSVTPNVKPQAGEEKKKNRFTAPTVEEVRQYCEERNNGIDPEQFIDYYQRSGWIMTNGQKVKDWKACIRTWERNNQKGVYNAGRSAGNQTESTAVNRTDYSFLRNGEP